jgi:hypothetical protein
LSARKFQHVIFKRKRHFEANLVRQSSAAQVNYTAKVQNKKYKLLL